jgi:hypothetical protein
VSTAGVTVADAPTDSVGDVMDNNDQGDVGMR